MDTDDFYGITFGPTIRAGILDDLVSRFSSVPTGSQGAQTDSLHRGLCADFARS